MADARDIPVLLLAFSNNTANPLPHLAAEHRQLTGILEPVQEQGRCQLAVKPYATVEDVLGAFQQARYRGRIALFHYAGHADGYQLLLEGTAGEQSVAHGQGLAAFFRQHPGLQLVFLNGCSTQPQAQALLEAGVAAVIATSQAIDDRVATSFAAHFYRALIADGAVRASFDEAAAALRTMHGDAPRSLYMPGTEEAVSADRWPWNLYLHSNYPNPIIPFFAAPPARSRREPERPSGGGITFHDRAEIHGNVAGGNIIIHGNQVQERGEDPSPPEGGSP